MNIVEVVAPEFVGEAKQMIADKLASGTSTSYELEIVAKTGRRVSLELSTRLIVADGKPVGVQGIGRDITGRKEAEASLHNAISLFASTFESTADGIIVVNHEQEVVAYNQKLVEIWDIPRAIAATKDARQFAEFVSTQTKDPESFLTGLARLYSDPLAMSTTLIELKNGRVYERYSQPHFIEGRSVGRVCCFRDVTERELAEEKFRHHALHDTLTSLPNRVQFMNHLRHAIDRRNADPNNHFAVLFLDLDRFKIINDSLGHVVGDKFLDLDRRPAQSVRQARRRGRSARRRRVHSALKSDRRH